MPASSERVTLYVRLRRRRRRHRQQNDFDRRGMLFICKYVCVYVCMGVRIEITYRPEPPSVGKKMTTGQSMMARSDSRRQQPQPFQVARAARRNAAKLWRRRRKPEAGVKIVVYEER